MAGSLQRHSFWRESLLAAGIVLATFFACQGSDAGRETAATAEWPGFLGAGSSTIEPASLPLAWSPTSGIAWTQETPGYGQSSPVIFGDRIFLTSVTGEQKQGLHILSYGLSDGALQWDVTTESTHPEKNSVYISRAAPTPVVDANGLIAYFESGDVVAVSHSGERRWHTSLTQEFGPPTNEFGLSASPVQTDSHVIILIDDPDAAYLVALDKNDGSVAWKTDRTPRTSWSSPVLLELDGSRQVVCSSAGSVDGYDAATGQQLWTWTEVGGNSATTPRPVADNGFLIAASPGRRGENADLAKESNGLMVVERQGDGWQPRIAWTNASLSPSWASPVEHAGYAYWINRVGAVFCVDAASGELVYRERLSQSAWATPVGVGDRLYVFGKEGLTTVLAAGPEFRVLAENALWTDDAPPRNNVPEPDDSSEERRRANAMFSRPTLYGVAVVNGHIVARSGSQLWCITPSGSR